jgi:cytochrome d ubiquinol oxidase subunit II
MSELGLPEILAAAVLFTLVAYALFAGADFGAGLWDLLASGPRAERQRETIAHAIGPIWEANHVWLILAVVLTFAAFPSVFATLAVRLHIPLALMLLGIVLRGASFVFRTYDGEHAKRRWGRRFAAASAVTPLLLGVIVGAITAPLPPVREDAWFWSMFMAPWLGPLPIATGRTTSSSQREGLPVSAGVWWASIPMT